MNEQKIKNVFALDSKERYGYLLRKVADFETIYLIADNEDKYVMIGSEEVSVIPVWPEKEFAELFLTDDWKEYKVVEYSIYDFMDWLDNLDKENTELAGFPNLDFNTVHVSATDMKNHLLYQISQYE
ncbi:DUF2750 domain-containing protein [Pontibacter sp. HSC-14F20]|uniref:DUF2750 domain-containing protein n=1 Tax=Pontibacter sp. HSC-14F20 TaxID=2864136 RepID=UPI001C730BBC|nr:DUF2750 domain-containing protein [Pontibacter sp. HSC-14F20]MBX0332215.1 DUF2750 domain-containing protein [Pontibacter sp. HSC-14F20]